jgi:hypothetical protein
MEDPLPRLVSTRPLIVLRRFLTVESSSAGSLVNGMLEVEGTDTAIST